MASLFVLRQRHPNEPRPFRAWGYPIAPAIFVLAAAVMLMGEFRRTPVPVAAGLGIILLGVPLYFVFRRR